MSVSTRKSDKNRSRTGVVACGALAREVLALQKQFGADKFELKFLPAKLHNSPHEIPQAVDDALSEIATRCDNLLVGYGDCGTGGVLDVVVAKHGATRIQGAHCYEFYLGVADFTAIHDEEPGTFYLTDFLVRQFDTLVYKPLGLDRHPELLNDYFGNYTRVLYLSQTADPGLIEAAKHAAHRLGLRFEHRNTGFGDLKSAMKGAA